MDLPFLRLSGSTPTANTGPNAAAVGAYYVYAETSNNQNLDFDLERSLPAGQELCAVAFAYHMYGQTMGSAVLETSADGTTWATLWSQSGDQGDQWLQASVHASSGQTMLRYRCVRARGLLGCLIV
jgi:hypothetical protein